MYRSVSRPTSQWWLHTQQHARTNHSIKYAQILCEKTTIAPTDNCTALAETHSNTKYRNRNTQLLNSAISKCIWMWFLWTNRQRKKREGKGGGQIWDKPPLSSHYHISMAAQLPSRTCVCRVHAEGNQHFCRHSSRGWGGYLCCLTSVAFILHPLWF